MKDKVIEAFKLNAPKSEMNKDEMEVLMSLLLSKDKTFNEDIYDLDKESEMYKHFQPLIKSFPAQVFLSRLKSSSTIRISFGVLIMLMHYMESAGNAVMYAFYIHNKIKPNTLVDFDVFSMDLFPWGMFSEEQLNNIWSTQKVRGGKGGSDNMLDYNEVWL